MTGGEVTETMYFKALQPRYEHLVLNVVSCVGSPDQLASYARKRFLGERQKSDEDGFYLVSVVTDVDKFSVSQLKDAEATCGQNGVESCLVISNPCFEVWLIDYRQVCSTSCDTAKMCEDKAKKLGLTAGQRNKELGEVNVVSGLERAISNAARHNTPQSEKKRRLLDRLDFAPWTDMPMIIQMFDKLNSSIKE